jgi:hypothetical protein
MATTPNYGWVMPDPTDFVTDLPADFEIFGDAVDATVDGIETIANAAQPNVITTEGDLVVGDASGDPDRLPIGAVGTVLTSDGDTAIWDTPAGGGQSYTLLNSGNTSVGASTSFTVSGISGINDFIIMFDGLSSTSTVAIFIVRFNSDTGTNYEHYGTLVAGNNAYAATNFVGSDYPTGSSIRIAKMSTNAASQVYGYMRITGANSTNAKPFFSNSGGSTATGNQQTLENHGGVYKGTSAITSITVSSNVGNFDAGNMLIYGSA